MTGMKRPMGRPRRFAKFEDFEAALPKKMVKRPAYCDGIGIFNGAGTSTVWVKVRMPRGGAYRGRTIAAGGSIEHKLGQRSSWDWAQLTAERDRLQGLADRGEALEAVQVETFTRYAADWLERRKATLKGYALTRGHIKTALEPAFGKKALNAITVSDVNRWIGEQRGSLAPATVQRQLATFNSILNDAVRSGVIERNPSERADRIKGIEARQRFVTDAEWKIILRSTEIIELEQEAQKELYPQQIRGWLRHYIVWAYNSGMRRSEILNLTWNCVRQVDYKTTVVEVAKSKTGKPRSVTCTADMLLILEQLKAISQEDEKRLFPVSLTTLKRSLTALWKKTGLHDVRLHDLRRSHATILVSQNVDPRTVASRLGHSGTTMLARHYAVDRGDMEAANIFPRTLSRNGSTQKLSTETICADDDEGVRVDMVKTGFD